MGKAWTRSPEQTAYLQSQFNAYLEAHKSGKIVDFRSRLYEGWARRWPEREVLFPSWKEGDTPLTKDQMEALGNAISKRKTQLYNYVRWHGLAKPVRTRSPRSLLSRYVRKVSNAKGEKATRKRTILEIYSELYYDSKLRNMVKKELDNDFTYASLNQNERSARQMAAYRKIRAEAYNDESADVKAEVQKIYNEEHHDKDDPSHEEDEEDDDDDDNNDDDDNGSTNEKDLLQRQEECVDVIDQVVSSFLQDLHEATGWAFYVLGGGMNKEGEIKVATSSIGKTGSGRTFHATHKNWKEAVIRPWLDFLQLRHSIEERHRRAMIWAEGPSAQDGSSSADITSENIIAPVIAKPGSPAQALSTAIVTPPQTVTPPQMAAMQVDLSTTTSSPLPPTISAGIISPSPDPSTAATLPMPPTVSADIISLSPDPSTTATLPTPPTISADIISPSLDPSAAATLPTPLTVSASNLAPASLANVTALANNSNYAHHVSLNGSSSHSLNVHRPPCSTYPASQAQIAPHATTIEYSPMSKFLIATNPTYGWDGSEVDNTLPVLQQPDSFNDAGTHSWNFPPHSTFSFPNAYQSNQTMDMTASQSHYSQALTMNGHASVHHGLFSVDQMANTSLPMTMFSPTATPVANTITTGCATPSPGIAAAANLGSGRITPFASAAPANGMAVQSAPNNASLNWNSINMENGITAKPVLTMATTNGILDEAGMQAGKRSKKRKSCGEENAELMLPEGARRAHKPRRMDENFVPSSNGRKKATKKAKAK